MHQACMIYVWHIFKIVVNLTCALSVLAAPGNGILDSLSIAPPSVYITHLLVPGHSLCFLFHLTSGESNKSHIFSFTHAVLHKKEGASICSVQGLTALSRVFIILPHQAPNPPLLPGQDTCVSPADQMWWVIMWSTQGRWWLCFTTQSFLECSDSSHGQTRSRQNESVLWWTLVWLICSTALSGFKAGRVKCVTCQLGFRHCLENFVPAVFQIEVFRELENLWMSVISFSSIFHF